MKLTRLIIRFNKTGLLLMLFSQTMLTPILINTIYKDGQWQGFIISYALTFLFGLFIYLPNRHIKKELKAVSFSNCLFLCIFLLPDSTNYIKTKTNFNILILQSKGATFAL